MPNLFSRVTGSAWSRVTTPAPEAREPVAPQLRASPAPRPSAPAPSAQAPAAAPAPAQPTYAAQPAAASHAAPPVQPRLSGLDPKDRLATSRAEEDLLDIPAFLRRQAN
jgi:cell division protein FtsZ